MLAITDTNFLIYLAKYKLWHKFEDLRFKTIMLPEVYSELKTLKQDLVLDLIKKSKIKVQGEKSGLSADNAILQKAKQLKSSNSEFVVATLDKALVKKIKKYSSVLTIRQKKYLKVI